MESEFKNVNLAKGLENVLDNYLINKFGKVIRTSLNYIDRLGREISKEDKEISPHSDICGFNRVYLHTKDNKRINVPCSYIVASLFVDNPNNYTSIEYKNLDKSDYKYSNLEWVKAFDNPKYDDIKDLDGEIWKTIPNYSLYKASNLGRIKIIGRDVLVKSGLYSNPEKAYLLNPSVAKDGYLVTGLLNKNTGKIDSKRVHRVIAETFIPNPNNLSQVDHINHDKTDNKLNNLRWVNSSENSCNGGSHIIELIYSDGHSEIVNSILEASAKTKIGRNTISKYLKDSDIFELKNITFKLIKRRLNESTNNKFYMKEKFESDSNFNIEDNFSDFITDSNKNIDFYLKSSIYFPKFNKIKEKYKKNNPLFIYWNSSPKEDSESFVIIDAKTFFNEVYQKIC